MDSFFQLDADIQLLLQRFGEETPQLQLDTEAKEESTSSPPQGKHFLNLLAQWSCDELDDKMKQRVEFSQRAIAKLLLTCARISERNGRLCDLLKGLEIFLIILGHRDENIFL
ncbi:unnamed protein product [Meloidogyne enterolobii]|uniref:Uncharacterized protein n=1 Tax=Meloidogyne enterolobii TaxID=390850 RepID=A0ACB1ARG4_MELEN